MAAAEVADLVLIPSRPGILDLRAIGTTVRIVKLAGKRAYVVLNAMPPRAPLVLADARAAVAVHGLALAPFTLQQRAAYAHSLIAGKPRRIRARRKGSGRDRQLYRWVRQELGLRTPNCQHRGIAAIRAPRAEVSL